MLGVESNSTTGRAATMLCAGILNCKPSMDCLPRLSQTVPPNGHAFHLRGNDHARLGKRPDR